MSARNYPCKWDNLKINCSAWKSITKITIDRFRLPFYIWRPRPSSTLDLTSCSKFDSKNIVPAKIKIESAFENKHSIYIFCISLKGGVSSWTLPWERYFVKAHNLLMFKEQFIGIFLPVSIYYYNCTSGLFQFFSMSYGSGICAFSWFSSDVIFVHICLCRCHILDIPKKMPHF